MTTSLHPYPAMKDSGVRWLGDVPEHWAIERLKSSTSNVIEQTVESGDDDWRIALEHVESWTGRIRRSAVGSFDSQVKRFRAGDVLFGKLRPYLAKVTRPPSNGVCVGEFLVLRPRVPNLTSPYLEELLRSKPVIDAVNSSTFGAKMPRADWQFLGGMEVPLPPLPEQAAIVRFLDHADRRIRRAIAAKRKLIALLNEEKQTIIQHAVTCGLDPTARLKPSGVEWLGDVPEHWEVAALGRLCTSRCDGPFGSGLKSAHYTDSGVRVIRLQNIGNGQFRDRGGAFIAEQHYATLGDHGVVEGDLLVAGLGDENIPAGRACIAPPRLGSAMVKADCFRFRLRSGRTIPAFLAEHLSATASAATRCLSTGATRLRINLSTMAARSIALPPLEEQRHIIDFIGGATAPIRAAIDRAQREIALLLEYRTRLIADVVTGKLDVREAAAALPDETADSEPLDTLDAMSDSDGLSDDDEEGDGPGMDAELAEASA